MSSGTARRRVASGKAPSHRPSDDSDDHDGPVVLTLRHRSAWENWLETPKVSVAVVVALTALAFALRFYKINHPNQVVFDEVHFGKFAAYYIRREYYFDVHPPFTKMMLGLAGWFVGFDGGFTFDNIGDNLAENHVPYVGMRSYPAILGSLTIPIVYQIMKEAGYSTLIAAFSAVLILLDNGHIAQSRLILLDAQLVFFTALSLYAYIRFRKLRYRSFTVDWWTWLVLTGVFLACTLGSKMVGLFTFATICICVLVDLWDILDVEKNPRIEVFYRHFMARAIGLILVPAIVYMSFFYVHFWILDRSGTGDTFMSPAFQETLIGNELLLNSQEIRYFDTVTIKHRDSKVFLHSHPDLYPLRYDDGRVSSQGQQVTGYAHDDINNHWQIIPTKAIPDSGRGRIVRHDDIIQLLHVQTQTVLLTHDVASPLMPTNQEFTTHPRNDHARHNDTLFQLHLIESHDGEPWKSKSGHFRLIHVPTKVSLWTHPGQLPEWAFNQQEVNGNKNAQEKTATWFVDGIIEDGTGEDFKNRTGDVAPKPPKSMNFFKKFFELQILMLQHNSGLTASHPYASNPINWPFLLNGISFWTQNEGQKQIYMAGNLIGWWTCVVSLSVYLGILGADLLARRRGEHPISSPVRNRLWNSAGLFTVAWACHYFPFFLMGRQLFVHHYLPAHLCSALTAGAVLSFILSETVNYPVSILGPHTRQRPRQYAELGVKGLVVFGVFTVAMLSLFLYMSPLTYGTPGLEGDAVHNRRLLSSWTLHFEAKQTHEVPV